MSPARPRGVPDVALAAPLRAALTAATYSYDAVGDLLGTTAQLALARNETTPALRRTTHGSPLETLVRLFLLQTEVDRADADRALPGLVDALVAGGMLVASGGEVRALLDCRPYADDDRDWWVVSDLTPGLDGQLDPRRAPTTCSESAPPRRPWPSSPSANRSPGRWTSAPAAGCRPCTSPGTPTRWSPPT